VQWSPDRERPKERGKPGKDKILRPTKVLRQLPLQREHKKATEQYVTPSADREGTGVESRVQNRERTIERSRSTYYRVYSSLPTANRLSFFLRKDKGDKEDKDTAKKTRKTRKTRTRPKRQGRQGRQGHGQKDKEEREKLSCLSLSCLLALSPSIELR
jgi:hypothetical protein